GVLASAVVGAFLQNRLALALQDQAVSASTQLPDQYRAGFISGFSNAAHNGFEVGAGQTGTAASLPAAGHTIAPSVFYPAFVDAMHPTLVLPIVVLVIAAATTGYARKRVQAAAVVPEKEAAVA